MQKHSFSNWEPIAAGLISSIFKQRPIIHHKCRPIPVILLSMKGKRILPSTHIPPVKAVRIHPNIPNSQDQFRYGVLLRQPIHRQQSPPIHLYRQILQFRHQKFPSAMKVAEEVPDIHVKKNSYVLIPIRKPSEEMSAEIQTAQTKQTAPASKMKINQSLRFLDFSSRNGHNLGKLTG